MSDQKYVHVPASSSSSSSSSGTASSLSSLAIPLNTSGDGGPPNQDFSIDEDLDIPFDDSKLRKGTSTMATCCGILCCPITLCCSWYSLAPNQEAIITNCGIYTERVTTPGCHFANNCGRDMHIISTRQNCVDLPKIKVLDSNGNPLMVSAVLVYRFVNTERAALAVRDRHNYVINLASATLRKIISHYPYESEHEHVPSLRTHLATVSTKLKEAAQTQLQAAGADAVTFQVNEISYAPEIASAMLKRQQADALVQARRTLVNGCTAIALDAVKLLEQQGVELNDAEKVRIVNNILTVTCSDVATVNTVSVGMDTLDQ